MLRECCGIIAQISLLCHFNFNILSSIFVIYFAVKFKQLATMIDLCCYVRSSDRIVKIEYDSQQYIFVFR